MQTNGLRALAAALPYNQYMTQLCLKDNGIGKDAVQHLVKGLAMNRSVRLLDLSMNPIGSQGIAILGELLDIKHKNCCPVRISRARAGEFHTPVVRKPIVKESTLASCSARMNASGGMRCNGRVNCFCYTPH